MRLLSGFLFAALFVMFGTWPVWAAPDADLWPDWQAHDAQSTQEIDHADWQEILDRYVTEVELGVTTFDYAGALSDGGAAAVASYVSDMADVAVDGLNRDQQFAYWVNLYNALTVKVVLDHYPVDSIRDIDISPGFFSSLLSSGPWGKKLITVEGRTLSLDDIEHRILRPIWDDPRIHYVVNCASVGCPALAPTAFVADQLEAQLDQAARDFINHPRAVRAGVDGDGGLVLSSLYDWYRDDFGARDADFIAHLKRFAGPDLMALLGNADGVEIAGYEYDWDLNDTRP